MQLDMERMTTPSTADIFFQVGIFIDLSGLCLFLTTFSNPGQSYAVVSIKSDTTD